MTNMELHISLETEGFYGYVKKAIYSPNGQYILASIGKQYHNSPDDQEALLLFDVHDGSLIRRYDNGRGGMIIAEICPNSKYILSETESKLIMYDIETGDVVQFFQSYREDYDEKAGFESAVFTPDNKYILSSDDGENFLRWDIESGDIIKRYENTNSDDIQIYDSISLSLDGKYALISDIMGNTLYWDMEDGYCIKYINRYGEEGLCLPVLSPNGKYVLMPQNNNNRSDLILYEIKTDQLSERFSGHTSEINTISFSKNGDYAASGDNEGNLILWDIANKKSIHKIQTDNKRIHTIDFSPDGKYILVGTSGKDKTLIVYDIASVYNIQTKTNTRGTVDDLSKWFDLLMKGAITKDEYDSQKKKLLE